MAVLIYTSWPNAQSAAQCAHVLVKERLVACVNILPGVRSIYHWQGNVCSEEETLMFLKTAAARIEALRARFLTLHPYEVPAFNVLPIDAAQSHLPYLHWVKEETSI